MTTKKEKPQTWYQALFANGKKECFKAGSYDSANRNAYKQAEENKTLLIRLDKINK